MNVIHCAADLPPGDLWIYGAGGRGEDLLRRIRALRPDVGVLGFVDSFRQGAAHGLPLRRFEDFRQDPSLRAARVVVASQAHGAILPALRQAGFSDVLVYEVQAVTALASALLRRAPAGEKITILDVGSRFCEGSYQEWERFLPPERLRVLGFEPDAAASEAARAELEARGVECEMVPMGLWSEKGVIPFYVIDPPEHSSCYPLNEAFVRRLRYSLASRTIPFDEVKPRETLRIAVDTLDNWWRAAPRVSPDFAKLDIQGGEFDVLKGGSEVLGELVGLKIEAWFAEFYKGAPLYSDIDALLRRHGFAYAVVPTDAWLPTIHGRRDAPVNTMRLGGFRANGQTVTADVYFLRDPIAMDFDALTASRFFTPAKMRALLALCECFSQYDYALELARWLPGAFARAGRDEAADLFAQALEEGQARYLALERENADPALA